MARVKRGTVAKRRHNKILREAKGYYGAKSRSVKSANEQLLHSGQYAFRDRRQKKRQFRRLWILRINAGCRQNGISYSRFINLLGQSTLNLDRKSLAEIATQDPEAFSKIVEFVKG